MKAFNNMMLILTEGCNLRCSYCYERTNAYNLRKRMSWQTAKKAVDLFFNQVPDKMEHTSISFFGGEPALEFDLMKKLIEYSYDHRTIRGYLGNKNNYKINTNGTILTNDMFDLYSRLGHKLKIIISVDGFENSHNLTRKMIDGSGSWKLIEKSFPSFKKLKEKFGVQVILLSTINKNTCRNILSDYIKLYELTGLPMGYLFVHEENWDKEDFVAIKEQVILLHDYCIKHKVRFPLADIRNYNSSVKCNNESNICSAGFSSFTVNYKGDIYPCHRFYYYNVGNIYKLGDINTGITYSKRSLMCEVNNLDKFSTTCKECNPIVRQRCHICIASNTRAYGNFYSISNDYCSLMKELYYILLLLDRENKECIDIGAHRMATQG